jgi:hypothetical protein
MILVYVQVLYCQKLDEQPGWQFSDRYNINEESCFLPLTVPQLSILPLFLDYSIGFWNCSEGMVYFEEG